MKQKYKTVVLSDLHLGVSYCRHKPLLRFLQHVECERVIVAGDGIDLIYMQKHQLPKSGPGFLREFEQSAAKILPHGHLLVLKRLQQMAAAGVQVEYFGGNHDPELRAKHHIGQTFFGMTIVENAYVDLPAGKRMLVTHGDEFDDDLEKGWRDAAIGKAYEILLHSDWAMNIVLQACGMRLRSLPKFVRFAIGINFERWQQFRRNAIADAKAKKVDARACGHIHQPEHSTEDGIELLNSGDWIESCTALVQDQDGRFSLVKMPLLVSSDERTPIQPRILPCNSRLTPPGFLTAVKAVLGLQRTV